MSTPHSVPTAAAATAFDTGHALLGFEPGRAPTGRRIPSPWDDAVNVLAIRLDTLGDVLMTTPAIRALKDSNPGRRVTLLTSSSGAAAAALVPEIDEVIVYEAPWMKASGDSAAGPDRAMIERLRADKFDAAVIFTVYSQNPLPAAMLCYLAEIPLRLAYCHENPYQLLTDWVPDREPARFIRHEAQRQLDLVAAIGCRTDNPRLSLHVPEAAQHRLFETLSQVGLNPLQPWAVIHPGATAASRRYPPEMFAQVAQRLICDHGIQVLLTGTAGEKGLIEQIRTGVRRSANLAGSRSRPRVHSLAGALKLDEMAALLQEAPVLISNNTGPVHMASALGTPVVVLYALTNPQHTPWLTPHRVLYHDDPRDVPCKFCYKSVCVAGHHNCLRMVTPDRVVSAALELLAAPAGPRQGASGALATSGPAGHPAGHPAERAWPPKQTADATEVAA